MLQQARFYNQVMVADWAILLVYVQELVEGLVWLYLARWLDGLLRMDGIMQMKKT